MRSWTSRAATGFPQGFHKILVQPGFGQCGLSTSRGLLRCPGLSSAEPFSRSTLYTWPVRATWLPQPLSAWLPRSGSGEVRESGSEPTAASSFSCLPQSLGGDGAGSRRRALHGGSLANVTPPLPIPCQGSPPSSRGRGTWRGNHGERGFCQRYETAC